MNDKLTDRLKALAGENQRIKKKGEMKIDGRTRNRGIPGKAGRKPKVANEIARGVKQYIDDHFQEEVKIEVIDPKTGKSHVINKPRVIRVLEMLYDIGVRDRNPDALSKWLDRALGKPAQPIVGEREEPIMLHVDF